MREYEDYVNKMHIANEDGGERSIASVRELISSTVISLIAHKYFPGKAGPRLSENELQQGIRKLAGLDDQAVDAEQFEKEVFSLMKMDGAGKVRDRILALEHKLIAYTEERRLEGEAVVDGSGPRSTAKSWSMPCCKASFPTSSATMLERPRVFGGWWMNLTAFSK